MINHDKPYEASSEEIKKNTSINPASYEKILIEIDSVTNTMQVKAKIDNHFEEIKKYRVSTGKKNIEKPFGDGKITQITLNPTWYPTADTISSFKKRGIELPSVVPPGSKFNYMGAAKINLTHEVNGKTTFRIHGTLDERTIGTNESAGCIRMKNAQVVELATLLNEFSHNRSLNDVNVVLK
jgi:L,D-transpeptidase YcfS